MSDLNSEIINWVKIAKGDLPGHPFHGNQWTSAQEANDHLKIANNLHLQHTEDADQSAVATQHDMAASLHRNMANRLRLLAQEAADTRQNPITADALRHAAELHMTAYGAHNLASFATLDHGIGQESVDAAYPASRASREATAATDQALQMARDTGVAPSSSSF